MRKMRFVFVTIFALLFISCYEVNEEIVINENGSGTYVTKMDMGQLLEMMQSMGGEEELTKEGLDKPIDTTIFMKDLVDTSTKATPEQKELVKDGKMHIQMNMKEKLFKTNIEVPFKNLENLQKLLSGNGSNGAGMSQIFKTIFDKGEEKAIDPANKAGDIERDPSKDNQLDQLSNVFDVTVKNGLLSRKLNAAKLKELTDKPEMAQMKELGATGMEITYTTTIKLPRPVKKIDNTLIKLSDDKRTLTFKYNLLDMFETPEKFSYTIEY